MKRILAAVTVAAALCAGCTAGTTTREVPYKPLPVGDGADAKAVAAVKAANAAADTGTGIRYLRASPYLLVNANGQGGLDWKILYIADPARKMSVEPYVRGASLDLTLTFRDGVLIGTSEKADATAVPKAILDAVEKILPSLAAAALEDTGAPKTVEVPAPHLFKIIVRGDTIEFRGDKGDAPVFVTVPSQPKE